MEANRGYDEYVTPTHRTWTLLRVLKTDCFKSRWGFSSIADNNICQLKRPLLLVHTKNSLNFIQFPAYHRNAEVTNDSRYTRGRTENRRSTSLLIMNSSEFDVNSLLYWSKTKPPLHFTLWTTRFINIIIICTNCEILFFFDAPHRSYIILSWFGCMMCTVCRCPFRRIFSTIHMKKNQLRRKL